MTAILILLKKYWKPLAIFVLVAFLLWRSYNAGYNSADAAWKLQWVQRDLSDATAALHRDVSERAEEQRRQKAVNEERIRADEKLAKVQADADAARRAGDGLQQQLKQLHLQLAGSETGRLSAIVTAGKTKAEANLVLAQLLAEADDLAGKYAEEADRAYVAGESCERIYSKVTNQ